MCYILGWACSCGLWITAVGLVPELGTCLVAMVSYAEWSCCLSCAANLGGGCLPPGDGIICWSYCLSCAVNLGRGCLPRGSGIICWSCLSCAAYVGLDQLFVKVSPECIVQMACMACYGCRYAAFALHAAGYRTGTIVQVQWYCEVE